MDLAADSATPTADAARQRLLCCVAHKILRAAIRCTIAWRFNTDQCRYSAATECATAPPAGLFSKPEPKTPKPPNPKPKPL